MFFLLFACSTTTTHLSSPYALEKGEMQLTVSGAGSGNTVVLSKSYQVGKALYEQAEQENTELTEREARMLLDSGIVWALHYPSTSVELLGRYGVSNDILEGLDVGLRTNFSAWKADAKLQLWENEKQAWAFNLGYGKDFSMVSSQVEWLTMTSFSRQDVDMSLIWGGRPTEKFDIYLGPRVLYSKIDTSAKISDQLQALIPESLSSYNPSKLFFDESMFYYGGTMGGKVGYKDVYLNLELNTFWVDVQPMVWGEKRDHSGLMISPVIGISYLPR